jgi:hypothetical protein
MLEGFRDGDLMDLLYYAPRIFVFAVLGIGATLILVLQRPLSRILVPMPEDHPRCPRCDHIAHQQVTPMCMQCGLPLDPEFMTSSPRPQPPPIRH